MRPHTQAQTSSYCITTSSKVSTDAHAHLSNATFCAVWCIMTKVEISRLPWPLFLILFLCQLMPLLALYLFLFCLLILQEQYKSDRRHQVSWNEDNNWFWFSHFLAAFQHGWTEGGRKMRHFGSQPTPTQAWFLSAQLRARTPALCEGKEKTVWQGRRRGDLIRKP